MGLQATEPVTVDEFLSLPSSEQWMELVDGEIVVNPRPQSDHQQVVAYLCHLFLERTRGRGRLIPEKEMIVRTGDGKQRVRCPDLMYVQETRTDIVTQRAVEGAADIVIEILSEGTEEVDRINKRDEYRASGVPEYWIVDLSDRAVLIHDFRKDTHTVYHEDDSFQSSVLRELGLAAAFTVREIFAPLPG